MDLRPRDLTIEQLRLIAKTDSHAGEEMIKTYYTWREARAMTLAKGVGAAALSILTAWLIPLLKHEYKGAPAWLVLITPAAVILSLIMIGMISLAQVGRVHQAFLRASFWLMRLK